MENVPIIASIMVILFIFSIIIIELFNNKQMEYIPEEIYPSEEKYIF